MTLTSMTQWNSLTLGSRLTALLFAALLGACSTQGFMPPSPQGYTFLQRAQEQESGDVRLRAAVPTSSEVKSLFGLDLHSQGVQPLWLEVENSGASAVWASHWSVDRDYFSPAEVAYTNRRAFSDEGWSALERWLVETAMPRRVPPGERRSGFIYTNLTPGTKGFNLDVFGPTNDYNFTMLIDDPDFVPDYRLVDFEDLYDEKGFVDVPVAELRALVEGTIPCCTTGPDGIAQGLPINLLLIGSGKAIRRSLIRAEWRETRAEEKTLTGEVPQHYDGRPADGRFYIERSEGASQIVLDVWLSRWRVDGLPVWVTQTYFREVDSPLVAALRANLSSAEQAALFSRFVGEAISADLDGAKEFVIQNLVYNQSVRKLGFARGMERHDTDSPGRSFDGFGYFTDGVRGIVYLSEVPVAYGDADLLFPSETGDVAQ